MKKRFIILLSLAVLAGPPAQGDEQAHSGRLPEGEIIVRSARDQSKGGGASVTALMHAPPERIWDTLLSCARAREYMAGMTYCEVLEFDGKRGKIRHVIDQPWPLPPLDIVFRSTYQPYSYIESSLVEGNLSQFLAEWRFEETPQGELVEYTVHIVPTYPVPRFFVRHYMLQRLPDMLACLRALADASGSAAQNKADAGRCQPGKPLD